MSSTPIRGRHARLQGLRCRLATRRNRFNGVFSRESRRSRLSSSMVEQWTFNPLVLGSSPRGGTRSPAFTDQSREPTTAEKQLLPTPRVMRMQRATSRSSRPGAVRRAILAAALAVGVLVVPQVISNPVTAQADSDLVAASDDAVGSASAFRPVNPIRILDTRTDPGIKRLWIESAFSIDPVTSTGVAAAAGVDPDDITAVIVNMTMVNAGSRGFGTVWPTGSERLETSINNVEFARAHATEPRHRSLGSRPEDLGVQLDHLRRRPRRARRVRCERADLSRPIRSTRPRPSVRHTRTRRRRVQRRFDADDRPESSRRTGRCDRRRAERHGDPVPRPRQLPGLGRRPAAARSTPTSTCCPRTTTPATRSSPG